MKAVLVIPKGWARVRKGPLREGDLFLDCWALKNDKDPCWYEWEEWMCDNPKGEFVIRRVKGKKR